MKRNYDPAAVRAAVVAVEEWIRDAHAPQPSRALLADATRLTARALEHLAPGHAVEVRVPPFVAVQCIDGPRHTRGTPPNVIECDPRTWLRLVTGLLSWDEATATSLVDASGARAGDISPHLPIIPLG